MRSKVYTFYGVNPAPILPMANYLLQWKAENLNRECRIKSILFQIQLYDSVTFEILDTSKYIMHGLNVGVSGQVGSIFTKFTPGFNAFTGNGFMLLTPGQYLFDSFYVDGTLDFEIMVENFEPVKTVSFEISVVAELEPQPLE